MTKLRFLPPFFFSFFFPGLGQIYNGQIAKGTGIILSFFLFLVVNAWIWLGVPGSTQWPLFLTVVGIMLVTWVYAQVDTLLGARAPRGERRWYQRWYSVLVLLLVLAVLFDVAASGIRANYTEPYVSPTQSMLPTVWRNDRFYADKRAASLQIWKRGDLIVFSQPLDAKITPLKRVIAVAGDRVEKTSKGISVNGVALAGEPLPCPAGMLPADEAVAQCRIEKNGGREYYILDGVAEEPMKPLTVPEGSLFVLGDNRANSQDSVHYGPIPIGSAVGRPLRIWYSSVGSRMGILLR